MTSVTELLEGAEQDLVEQSSALHKLADRITKGRKELAKGARPLPVLRSLLEEVRKFPRVAGGPNWDALIEGLTTQEAELSGSVRKAFPAALRDAAAATGLSFRGTGDPFAVGPFGVRADYAKDTASIEYAKIDVAKDLPLDAPQVVSEVVRLRDVLLAPLDDPKAFAKQLEEAVHVVLARQRKSHVGEELRADIPLVYRELLYLRQGWTSPTAKRKLTDYPVSRFVVETKTLLQSEANLDSPRPFRLESAVIENTKNLSKAFYFPKDLADGCGEGMYFQAILLTKPR